MAKAKLDEIIAKLEDEKATGEIVAKHEKAYDAAYKGRKKKVQTHNQLHDELEKFIKGYKKALDQTVVPDHVANAEARQFLVAYGRQVMGDREADPEKAIEAALKQAKQGKLSDILHAYKTNQRGTEESQYGQMVLNKAVDVFDLDHQSSLAKEYLDRHGHLLGPKLKDFESLKPDQLAHKYLELLGGHRQAIESFKSHTKKYKPPK